MVKLQINFERKHLFVLLILAGVILAGFVLAQTYQNPQTGVGHNYNELQPCPANQILKSDGNVWTCVNIPAAGGSFWQPSGNDIYYNNGNVGIGTAPAVGTKLDVNGFIRGLKYEDDDPTYYLDMNVGGRLKSLNIDNSLVVNGNVGIGTSSPPAYRLDVGSNARVQGDLLADGNIYLKGHSLDTDGDGDINYAQRADVANNADKLDGYHITDFYYCVDFRWISQNWVQTRLTDGNKAEYCDNNWGNCNWIQIGKADFISIYGGANQDSGAVLCQRMNSGKGIFLDKRGMNGYGFGGGTEDQAFIRTGIFTSVPTAIDTAF